MWQLFHKTSRIQAQITLLSLTNIVVPAYRFHKYLVEVNVLVTTTSVIQGYKVTEYLDIVTGETIMGANILRDLMASITDIVGGRSGAYEGKLHDGRLAALNEMKQAAAKLGANAVIGVDIDYEVIGNSMLMVAASGTAVKLMREE